MNLPPLLVVIHETVISAKKSMAFHADPQYYASYHSLIELDGTINYLVPAEHKAFAAAISEFIDPITKEAEHINGSVDDFAYHIALETPIDGRDGISPHSGYTYEQYKSLAWLCVSTGVQDSRIVTHGEISIPPTLEPRCFNIDYFFEVYSSQKGMGRKRLNMGLLDNVE